MVAVEQESGRGHSSLRRRERRDSGRRNSAAQAGEGSPLLATSGQEALVTSPPSDATVFNGHRYLLVPEGDLPGPRRRQRRAKMGGHLATLTSEAENEMATALARDLLLSTNESHNAVWIGLSETAEGAGWKWVTGEPLDFSQWLPGEPSGGRGRKVGPASVREPFLQIRSQSRRSVGTPVSPATPAAGARAGASWSSGTMKTA